MDKIILEKVSAWILKYNKDLSWDHVSTVLFSKPIGDICCQHDLLYYCYVDDTQVYIAILPKETWLDVSKKMEAYVEPGKDRVYYFQPKTQE